MNANNEGVSNMRKTDRCMILEKAASCGWMHTVPDVGDKKAHWLSVLTRADEEIEIGWAPGDQVDIAYVTGNKGYDDCASLGGVLVWLD